MKAIPIVQTSFEIAGQTYPRMAPTTVAELQELVRSSKASGTAVYPLGGGTQFHLGLPPTKEGQVVDMKLLSEVVDYPARDMTITVQAGIRIAELQKLLASENQRLPIDIPFSDQATLGGSIATNQSGSRRFGCGTLRDYVIGISLVNDQGEEVKGGGRVVKNVAGYDLCKLMIGSLGTLGVISQVTLKVVPKPESTAILNLVCPENDLDKVLGILQETRTRPTCLDLLNPAAVRRMQELTGEDLPEKAWIFFIGFESNEDAVKWQVQQLIKEVKTDYSLEVRVGHTAQPFWSALEGLGNITNPTIRFKASMLSSRCVDYCRAVSQLEGEPIIQAHAGNGIVKAQVTTPVHEESGVKFINSSRDILPTGRSSLTLEACPHEWKTLELVWGKGGSDLELMRAIKQKLDPEQIFNPGRYVGGL